MRTGHTQMTVFSALVTLVAVASLAYILLVRPDYLRASRNCVPFHTPPVIHPETGEPLDVDTLVEHFKGAMQ